MRVQVIDGNGEQIAEFETSYPWVLFDSEKLEVRDEHKDVKKVYPSLDSTFRATPEMILKVIVS